MTTRKKTFALFQLFPIIYWAIMAYAMSEGKYEIILSNGFLLAAALLPAVIVTVYLYHDGERIRNIVYVCLTSLFLMLSVNSCINDYYVSGVYHRTKPEISNGEEIKKLPENTVFAADEIKLDANNLIWVYSLQSKLLSVTAMYPVKDHNDVWIVYRHETNYGHGEYYDNPESVLYKFPTAVYSPSCYTIGWKPSLEEAMFSGHGRSFSKDTEINGPGKHLLKNKSKVYVFYDQRYSGLNPPSNDNSIKGVIKSIVSVLLLYVLNLFPLFVGLAVIIFIDYLEEGDDYEINLSWWRDLLSNDEEDDDQES